MRYPASEKLEIIRLVDQSHLGVKPTLDKLGIPKTTFYRWYDRYVAFGEAFLEERNSNPGQVWNRIPDGIRQEIIHLALEERQLSPRELAVRCHGHQGLLRLGSLGLPASQGPRPDHQPGLCRHQGGK